MAAMWNYEIEDIFKVVFEWSLKIWIQGHPLKHVFFSNVA